MKSKGSLLLLFLIALGTAQAQVTRTGDEDTIRSSVVTIFSYEPVISNASKMRTEPTAIDSTVPKPEVDYDYQNRQFKTSYKPDTIEPAKMKGEPIDPLYRGYVKAGAGNGINYLLDAYINTSRSRDVDLGVELHSRGTEGNLSDALLAPYNRTMVAAHGKKFLKRHSLEGRIGYDRERLQYYGSDETNPFYFNLDQDVFRQVYQDVFASGTIKSFYTDSSKVNHVVDVDYDFFTDRGGANTEHNAKLNSRISRYFGRHLGDLGINLDMNSVNYADSFSFQPTGIIEDNRFNLIAGVNPKMISTWKKFRFELGLKAMAEFRNNSSSVHLYPDIYAKYNLVKEVIIPYAGITGGLQRNSLRSMTETNPFLWTSNLALRNTNELFRFYGGFRGAVSDELTFNLQFARYRQEDSPLYVNYDASQYNLGANRFGENFFLPVYDTLDVVEFNGEIMFRQKEKLQLAARGVYRSYTTTSEFEAWHRPTFELGFTGFYHLRHKIILKATSNVLFGQWAKVYVPDVTAEDAPETDKFFSGDVYGDQLAPVLDFNIGGEYRYTEQLSLFLNVNNVIAQRYQRWNNFPNQRINVLAGLTYSFWKD